jgi:phosphoribosylformylglycinamidine cyclo-ligase
MENQKDKTTYQQSGVSIDAGNSLVEKIKPLAQQTMRPGVASAIGGFGGLFDLAKLNYKDPLLISATDGVGTKLKLAQQVNKHSTIGIDLVAMCVNDLLVHGAEPLFFLDYIATGKLNVDQMAAVVAGIAKACKETGCALLGGETAEMPGMYNADSYDLAGFAVGIVEREQLLPKQVNVGDVVVGLSSSGLHSNGFSLVRYLLDKYNIDLFAVPPFESECEYLYEELLQPTQLYVQQLLPLIKQNKINALAHITGGGVLENIPRVLPDNECVELHQWKVPPLFAWLAQLGSIERQEMLRTFNMGIGMIAIMAPEHITDDMQVIGIVKQRSKESVVFI